MHYFATWGSFGITSTLHAYARVWLNEGYHRFNFGKMRRIGHRYPFWPSRGWNKQFEGILTGFLNIVDHINQLVVMWYATSVNAQATVAINKVYKKWKFSLLALGVLVSFVQFAPPTRMKSENNTFHPLIKKWSGCKQRTCLTQLYTENSLH